MSIKANHIALALALVAALVIAGVGVFAAKRGDATPAPVAPPAAEVDVATVVAKTITNWQDYSGRLEAVDHVEIRSLVSGTIVAVRFQDGAMVKKGDPLLTIDPRPYHAAVDSALAQVAAAQARVAFTSTDQARAQRLLADNAIAQRDFDQKTNDARAAAANLDVARAALENARLNLGYTNIVAPVSGRVSRAEMTLGNIVNAGPGSPLLTTLVSMSPIYASFDVDEQTYLQYLSHDAKNTVPVWLGLANEEGYSRSGSIASVDNRLDTSSGTIRVRARFDNADGTLVPGLFARLRVGGGAPHPAVLIDERAIGTDQDKKFVLVIDAQNHAQYRQITEGEREGGLRIVLQGLKPGERIVVNGLQRVRPGDTVKPDLVQMAGDGSGNDTPPQGS